MIEIYLLEALVSFQECGTLSRAAEQLHISQPALSRAMKKLEESFDVPLFNRTGNSISLNETGKFAASVAANILTQERNMMDQVRNYAASFYTISVGYCAPGPSFELSPLLTDMYPHMKITSEVNNEESLLNGLQDGKYTYVILSHEVHDQALSCTYYGHESLYVSAVPAHPLSAYKDAGIHFRNIDGETFLQFSDVGVWENIKTTYMPHARILKQENRDSLREIINSSSLLSFATDISIRYHRAAENPGRIFIPIIDPGATVHYYLVSRRSEENSVLMQYCRSLSAG